jgi:hypothetical protein
MVVATLSRLGLALMPPPGAVEAHARGSGRRPPTSGATSSRGPSKDGQKAINVTLHGPRPWHQEKPSPMIAANVMLHGARPWHPSAQPHRWKNFVTSQPRSGL